MGPRVSVITPVFRSGRWLPGYFKSLKALSLEDMSLEVVVIDNDPRAMSLEEYIAMAGDLEIKVISNDSNVGFARACNQGASAASGSLLLFLNVDTCIEPGALALLRKRLEHSPGCAVVEAAQLPNEHPKFVWPLTGRTEWCSAACMLMRRDLFLDSGGFDEIFFMYGEDVDLCFRLRDRGYRLVYAAEAACRHFEQDKDDDDLYEKTYNMVRSGLLLRARYADVDQLLTGFYLEFMRTLLHRRGRHFTRALSGIKSALFACPHLVAERVSKRSDITTRFFGDDGSFALHYRFPVWPPLEIEKPESPPSFSVIIATENRNKVVEPLAESLLAQMDRMGAGELILVDHGPIVGAADGLAARLGGNERFRLIDHPEGCPADGKNAAVRTASGEILIFLDDDVIPDENLLFDHLLLQTEHDVVQGNVIHRWPVAGSQFRRFLRDRLNDRAAERTRPAELPWSEFSTSNCSVKKELLLQIEQACGFFDRRLWDDDTADQELAWRLGKVTGVRLFYHPRLGVIRREVPRFPGFLAGQFRAGYSSAQLSEWGVPLPDEAAAVGWTRWKLLKKIFFFLFFWTPLSAPANLLDLAVAPSARQNPITAWWFVSIARLCRAGGRLWHKSLRGRDLG